MRFSCERCGKRYASSDVPVPGRLYRVKCKACGNLILVRGETVSAAAPTPPKPAPQGTNSATAPAEWSAATTPLTDLVRPPEARGPSGEPPQGSSADATPPSFTASSPPPLPPGSAPAPAAADPKYIELFDERDLAEVTLTPVTGSRELGAAATPLGAAEPHAPSSPDPSRSVARDDSRDALDSLDQGPPADDPFASVREELEAAAETEKRLVPPSPSLQPEADEPEMAAAPPSLSPLALHPAPRRGLIAALGLAGAAVVLVLVALAIWRPFGGRPAGPSPGAPLPTSPAATPPPAPAPPPAAAAPSPAPPSTANATAPTPPPAEPARPSSDSTAAPPPQTAEAPAAKPSPAPAPARPPPPRTTEKQVRPAKPPERKVAKAERRDTVPPPAEPAQAPAPPAAAEPEARESELQPSAGLTPDEVQRVLGTGRRAFDACLRDPSRGLDQPIGPRQVTLRFTVEPEGKVSYPTIDDVTISAAPLGQCLKAAARGLSFPAFRGDPVKVDVPIAIPAK